MAGARVSQQEAIARAAALPPPARDGVAFIGVDGFGASGKSTFARRLAAQLPGSRIVHIDDFAAPGVPEWDWSRFREQVLVPLLAGRKAHYLRWDWHRDEAVGWREIPPGRTVVVEGVSSTRRETGAPWALTVWVDAPAEVRLARIRQRDGERLLPTWLNRWIPEENAWAAHAKPLDHVDLVVSGTEPDPASGVGGRWQGARHARDVRRAGGAAGPAG
ncbi:MAG TPA: AAA family ATPase [Jatrophihabitans sp.]|nr:AAA family ATPase [Jatrophihabitans sp.]